MSSLSLSSLLNPNDLATRLTTALSDVAERSFFALAEPCDRETFVELTGSCTGWSLASVAFRGETSGTMWCALPSELMQQLFEAFAGVEMPEDPHELVNDLLGEFANMVCGAWLSPLAEEQPFALLHPEVVRMPEDWRPSPDFSAPEVGIIALVNGFPMAIMAVPHERGSLGTGAGE